MCYGGFHFVREPTQSIKNRRGHKQDKFVYKIKENNVDKAFEPNDSISDELLTFISY